MRTRRLTPRTVAIAIAAAVTLLVSASSAQAGHWWLDSYGQPVHLGGLGHTPTLGVENNATNPNVRLAIYRAMLAWQTPGYLGIIEMPTGSGTHVRAADGYWGSTGWVGLASPYYYNGANVLPGIDGNGHTHHFDVSMNMTYLGMSHLNNQQYYDAVACHELGHSVAALDDQTGTDPSCMAVGYGQRDYAWETDARFRNPSPHDRDHVAYLWATLH